MSRLLYIRAKKVVDGKFFYKKVALQIAWMHENLIFVEILNKIKRPV